MNGNEMLELYRRNRLEADEKNLRMIQNPFLFRLFLLRKLPMGFMAGIRLKELNENACSVTVPYRWLNQNPFRSTYFAVLSMAAEISTGIPAMLATATNQPSVSMLVTHSEADFMKKATGLTTFTCRQGKEITQAVEQAILTGEAQTFEVLTTGTSESGEIEAQFLLRWSFRMRNTV